MRITVTLDHAQREGGNGGNQVPFSSKSGAEGWTHPSDTLFHEDWKHSLYLPSLTDGDKAAGPTAMLPKLCRDCLTIKISKEITLAYWQLFQLFAPVSLVLHVSGVDYVDSCWPHFTFPQVIYPQTIFLTLPGDGNLHENVRKLTAALVYSLHRQVSFHGSVTMFMLVVGGGFK